VALADPASGSSTAESLWLLGKQRISDDEMELALRINVLPGSFARIHFDTNQIALCALGSLHNFGNDEWSNGAGDHARATRWYSWVGSNHRPPDPQSGALTN
jgi:hypothetical protein